MSTSYIIIFLLCRAMHCTRKNDELHLRMTTSYRLLFCEVIHNLSTFFLHISWNGEGPNTTRNRFNHLFTTDTWPYVSETRSKRSILPTRWNSTVKLFLAQSPAFGKYVSLTGQLERKIRPNVVVRENTLSARYRFFTLKLYKL